MVWVSLPEVAALAGHLGLLPEGFGRKYLRLVDDRLSLIEKQNFDCVFLEGSRCSVYPVRPRQCRLFPFWEGMLLDETTFKHCTEFCPGIGKGHLHTEEEIDLLKKER